jgi:hypothetical protein
MAMMAAVFPFVEFIVVVFFQTNNSKYQDGDINHH